MDSKVKETIETSQTPSNVYNEEHSGKLSFLTRKAQNGKALSRLRSWKLSGSMKLIILILLSSAATPLGNDTGSKAL